MAGKPSADNALRYQLRLQLEHKDVLRNKVKALFCRYASVFRKSQVAAAHRLRSKWQSGEKIEVAFLLTIPGMWKLDYLFRAMQQSPRYHPYVVIYPYSTFKGFDGSEIEDTLQRTKQFIAGKGYEYTVPCSNGVWQDIQKTLHPDIVFFTSPYRDFPGQYYIYHFRHTLACYVPYAFCNTTLYHENYDIPTINLVGMHFVETSVHQALAQQYGRTQGRNAYITGYPGTECYLHPYTPRPVWKVQSTAKKRVIWAPHHSINGTLDLSTFLDYSDLMLQWADKYGDSIQFVFKPHQLLKFKLCELWGSERTEAYYRRWNELPNTQLELDSYLDYFLTADAMLHDSGSFTTEFLYTRKPVMYLTKGEESSKKFNPFGLMAFQCHYHGHNTERVEWFLQEVVLNGQDPMLSQREAFYRQYLQPVEGMLPSQRILQHIEQAIHGTLQGFEDKL